MRPRGDDDFGVEHSLANTVEQVALQPSHGTTKVNTRVPLCSTCLQRQGTLRYKYSTSNTFSVFTLLGRKGWENMDTD